MQSTFTTYFSLGYHHILDLQGLDHMLFLLALCAVYTIQEWKKLLILVTAFTIGHSLTLALSALNVLLFRQDVIEFLIPVTIFLTAVLNVFRKEKNEKVHSVKWQYSATLFFGLIHGMGFSNFFKAALLPGESASLVYQLFAFNLGVEAGQVLFVILIAVLSWLVLRFITITRRDWTIFVSGIAAGISLLLMAETAFW